MIFTSCSCGEPYTISYECGEEMGYNRVDCKCGKILMVERNSNGETVIFDNKKEFKQFLKDKKIHEK